MLTGLNGMVTAGNQVHVGLVRLEVRGRTGLKLPVEKQVTGKKGVDVFEHK